MNNKIAKVGYFVGGLMNRAGAETMIMNYVREISRDEHFEIEIIVHGNGVGDYDEELKNLGIKIFHLPRRFPHVLKYVKELRHLLKNRRYDIVHGNLDCYNGILSKYSKKENVPVIIAHSHIAGYQEKNSFKRFFAYLSKRITVKYANCLFACSKAAGDWMYRGEKYLVINNAIPLEDFAFDENFRSITRKNLNISENSIVLGHIGRFMFQKNHEGLINIFEHYHSVNNNSVLLCVGSGEDYERIKLLVEEKHLENYVKFLGIRSDIRELMCAMDIFLLPSFFEGLPVVGIEAQANGLPCVFSESVTQETCILKTCRRVSINNLKSWVDSIEEIANQSFDRNDVSMLFDSNYSIKKESLKLINYYLRLLQDHKI